MPASTFRNILGADRIAPENPTENSFSIYKTDDDKRLVFGWASIIIKTDGEQLVDRQQDLIDPEDLEEAAYDYVLNFRDTGEQHNPNLRKKGKLVESCVLTAEKQKAMGIPEGTLPVGWWIGFKIDDDAAWEKVKNGTYRMFSIEGRANREPVEKHVVGSNYSTHYMDYPSYDMWLEENLEHATIEEQKAAKEYFSRKRSVAKSFDEILKFNPYHDSKGRFTSAGRGAVSAFPVDTPYSAAREKERVMCCAVKSSEYKGIELPPSPENRLTRYLDDETKVVDGKVHGGIGHVQFMENGNLITSRSHSADDVKLAITDICERLGGCYEEGVFYRTTNNKNEIKLLESGKLMPSKNHLTGESEDGLSVWGTPKNMGHEYTYKISGKIKGYGSDGEPILDMSTLKVVGKMVNDGSYHVENDKKRRAGEEVFKKTFNWTDQQLLCAKKGYIGNIFTGNGIVDIERMKVQKFNPFHDALGRFASSAGFKTYSANPKSKAGAMAISRSAQAGHGTTFNVHRESQGENIDQNYKWLNGGPGAKQLSAQGQLASQQPKQPPKPQKNYDSKGYADYDDADYHQLYNGRQYYQQQQLSASQKQAADSYMESWAESGSLYSHSQNMNYMMSQGQTLTGKYKQTHDELMSAMHNVGYNVTLTRYDHDGMIDGLLQSAGVGRHYEYVSESAIQKALVGKTVNENKFISTSYNDFKNATDASTFTSRAVKVNYKVKADTQAMMPGVGPGGDFGEMILAPTNGTTNRGGKIVGVRWRVQREDLNTRSRKSRSKSTSRYEVIRKMSRYDTIKDVTVAKTFDEIVEVNKFNPFHDAMGRFSSSNGFKSYSANPNTRAGAMAIARSAAAGHGTTMNVHREATSTGPTIRHNANWLGSGNQQNSRWQGSGTLRNRVEPIGGLQGASATGSSWQYQNQQRGRTTTGGKQPAQKPAQQQATQKPQQTQQAQQKPQQAQQQQQTQQQSTGSLAANTKGVTLTSGDRLAIQPRDSRKQTTTDLSKAAPDHYQDRVAGSDISASVNIKTGRGAKSAIDQVTEAQGWNKASTVTNDLETFQKAAKQSGQLIIRTVHGNRITGESSIDVCNKTMTDGNASLNGTGMQYFGGGLYTVGAKISDVSGRNMGRRIANSQELSFGYGDTQMMATVQPGTKIASYTQTHKLQSDFTNMSSTKRAKFGNDIGAYIASKGYDGAQWHDDDEPYITMYNKSSIIYYGEVASN